METTPILTDATTAGGYLLVLSIMLPATGILLALVLGGRHVERIAIILLPIGLAVAAAVLTAVWQSGRPLVYIVGGWAPPLGIALRADGISAAMMAVTSLV